MPFVQAVIICVLQLQEFLQVAVLRNAESLLVWSAVYGDLGTTDCAESLIPKIRRTIGPPLAPQS